MATIRDYSDEIEEYWPTIMLAWEAHRDKHPVIVCDLASRTVAAYPAQEYIDDLSERTRSATRWRFDELDNEGGMMVFVRDSDHRKLQSYSFAAQDIPPVTKRRTNGSG